MRELTAIQFTVCCSESSSEPRVYTPQLGGRYYWQILSEPLVLPHSSQRERERERAGGSESAGGEGSQTD